MELSEFEQSVVMNRLSDQLPRVERSGCSEERKLRAIGKIVDAIITDLRDPLYGKSTPKVIPSILPNHDDSTIDRMAHWQRKLRESGMSPEMQALQLDRLEHYELTLQRDERAPSPKPLFDDEAQVSYHFD